MTGTSFELGINYWPSRQAMYMWRELALAEVRDDVQHIADIGFDTVRIFALTEDFLPERGRVDATMLNCLVEVVRIAADARRPCRRAHARAWVALMASALRRGAPDVPVRIGAHLPSLTTTNHMRVDDLGGVLDEDVMHAYPLYSASARSFLDSELVPFACALTSALSGRGRLTLMQEFGLCTAPRGMGGQTFTDDFLGTPRAQYLASEEEGAAYYSAVLDRLVRTGAAGAYAWCYSDYAPQLFHRPPLVTAVRERTFGLVRADGSEKPAVHVFRDLRRTRDDGRLCTGTAPTVLDVSPSEYYADPGAHFDRLYARWIADRE